MTSTNETPTKDLSEDEDHQSVRITLLKYFDRTMNAFSVIFCTLECMCYKYCFWYIDKNPNKILVCKGICKVNDDKSSALPSSNSCVAFYFSCMTRALWTAISYKLTDFLAMFG